MNADAPPAPLRIDFYILSDESPNARDRLCCRLAEKAWKLGHSVYLHTASAAEAAAIDELLWTFRDGSFVPHGLSGEAGEPPPVLIGAGDAPATGADVLINLCAGVPEFHARFPRIVEIVAAPAPDRAAGRERFRYYRERGHQPQSHKIQD